MTNPPFTVLYLDHTAKWSGGEIALLRLIEALDMSRVRPVVILAEEGPLVERLRAAHVEVQVIPLSSSIREVRKDTLNAKSIFRHLGTAIHLVGYAAKIARLAHRYNAVIIHTNSLKSDLYGALAGRLAALPVIWHVRDHIEPAYLPSAAVTFFRYLARRLPTYLVTNSQSTLNTLYLSGQQPTTVIHSSLGKAETFVRRAVIHDGLDAIDMFAETSENGFHVPVRIGIVGRIAPWKGQQVFLEAAAHVVKAGYDARFFIIGAPLFGEEGLEQQLRKQAEDSGILSRVEFMGFQKDIPRILRGLDILVHASTTPEPFGQVVTEGMAARLPVIATDGGGVREIVTNGENGLLVPMGDADALGKAIMEYLANPARAQQIAQAGYLHVRRHFTSAQSARKMEKVYEDVLAQANRKKRLGSRIPMAGKGGG